MKRENKMKKIMLTSTKTAAALAVLCSVPALTVNAETPQNGWYEENGCKYWYENGVRQGTEGRGKEIYDPVSDGWYWLDAVDGGKMATGKEVYQESNGGKWVRYDENGKMVKGWYTNEKGTYYYDPATGAMVKGITEINNIHCIFDENTGIGLDCKWYEVDGIKYWYEDGARQGTEGRGKEIYDPGTNAWYWLDAVDGGKMAVSKDVYQESDGGKWVRYDENGHMIKGENKKDDDWYYFDLITGAMIKGWHTVTDKEGKETVYYYDEKSGKKVFGHVVIDEKYCAFDPKTGAAYDLVWLTIDGGKYWYEKGVRQGTEGRGKEIFDPATEAWYWLDAVDNGKMAVGKDVYQESDGGKWVRYDAEGRMIKGENQKDDAWYRFDLVTGAMIKGWYTVTDSAGKETLYYYDEATGKKVYGFVKIDNKEYAFDTKTGAAIDSTWLTIDGEKYWYVKGLRQGTEGVDMEIYDPTSKAWYLLDGKNKGKMVTNKDVYKEADGGKWVRYGENGQMVRGWTTIDGKKFYYDVNTGARAAGIVRIDGTDYYFDETTGQYQGVYEGGEVSYSWLNTKETRYDVNGTMLGYTVYEYTDNGSVERERVYNGDKRLLTEEKYTYDESGRQVTYSFRNYTNSDTNYTLTTSYTNNLITQEVKKDKNGVTTEVIKYTYVEGKLARADVYNASNVLQYYYVYTLDAKGNIVKEQRCNLSGIVTEITTNTYYEYGGQSFLRQSLVYNGENKILSGVNYTRNGFELAKEVYYGENREVTGYTVYQESLFPNVEEETNWEKESSTYDAKDNLQFKTVYEYEVMEIRQ